MKAISELFNILSISNCPSYINQHLNKCYNMTLFKDINDNNVLFVLQVLAPKLPLLSFRVTLCCAWSAMVKNKENYKSEISVIMKVKLIIIKSFFNVAAII